MNRRCFLKSLTAGLCLPLLTGCTNENNPETENNDGIDYFEIHLANYCNLNCKYCDHFSNIADKTLMDIETFEKDIKQITKITKGKIQRLNLLGGEPLLNPDIIKYIEVARKYLKNTDIQIITNGLLLNSMKPEFWQALHDYDIMLQTSFYKVNIDWKAVYEKIQKYNIKTAYGKNFLEFSERNKIQRFIKFKFDLTGSQTDFLKCQNCRNFCQNLFEGKFYICSYMAYVQFFNKKFNQNIEVVEGDYLDIYKMKNIKEFFEWKKSPKPFCRYCRFDGTRPWEASQEHDISEWT